VERPVDRHLGQIQATDAVVARDRLVHERVEHPGGDPLVAATAQGGLPHTHQPAGVHPRAAQRQPVDDAGETDLVVDARPMTAERMIVGRSAW
jgi:hypothetical protein